MEEVHEMMKGPTQKVSQFRLSGWFSAEQNVTQEIFGAAQPVEADMNAKGFKKLYDVTITKTSTSVPFVESQEVDTVAP